MEKKKNTKADDIRVGGYQILTALLLSINLVTVAMSHALSIFYKYTPRFYCQESAHANHHEIINRTYGCQQICRDGYAFESHQRQFNQESTYDALRSSVVTEWHLVCERAHLQRALGELYFAGLLFGGLIAGYLADRLGRLPILAVCLYAQGVLAVGLNLVEKYKLFLILRGLQGFFIQGLESCTFVLCMELFPVKYRTLVAFAVLTIRSLGLLLISGFSYFIPDWRVLQLISCVPTAITVIYIWLIPESPRWLLAKDKTIDAELLIERITKYNSLLGSRGDNGNKTNDGTTNVAGTRKKTTSDDAKCADLEKSLHESLNLLSTNGQEGEEENEKKNNDPREIENCASNNSHANEETKNTSLTIVTSEKIVNNAIDINNGAPPDRASNDEVNPIKRRTCTERTGFVGFFKKRFIGRTCVLLMFAWFASSLAFHSLVGMPQKLSTDRHVSLSLAALMEIGTFALSYLLATSRCGRRWGLSIGQILGGSVCLAIAVVAINNDGDNEKSTLKWIAVAKLSAVVIGRIVNIVSFFILRLMMIELLPTTSRATGVGLCIGAEMIGGLLMPFVLKLNRFVPELGRIAIGLVCICSGLLVISLPETLRTVLPDSVDDARRLVRARGNMTNDDDDDDDDDDDVNDNDKMFKNQRSHNKIDTEAL